MVPKRPSPFGLLLKQWRAARRVSQLELGLMAEVSARHISFLESGRSRPSDDMVIQLCEALDVPLRERNELLRAAGLVPLYDEASLSTSVMAPFRQAIDRMLEKHEPYPAIVINRWWDIVEMNQGAERFYAPMIQGAEVPNGARAVFDPGPVRDMIDNWDLLAHSALHRLRRESAEYPNDERLADMIRYAESALADVSEPPLEEWADAPVICPRFRIGDQVIETLTTVAQFSTAREVGLSELRVELVFPANEAAEQFFEALAMSSVPT